MLLKIRVLQYEKKQLQKRNIMLLTQVEKMNEIRCYAINTNQSLTERAQHVVDEIVATNMDWVDQNTYFEKKQ